MRIAGFQKLTLLDYPGKTACTLFTRGCNFCCPFCHNAPLVTEAPGEAFFSEEEIFAYLKKRGPLLDGLVISGGEPCLDPDLIAFLERVRAAFPLLVKLDTNGSLPAVLKKILDAGLVDYVAMDIKNSLAEYDAAVGCHADLDAICQSIALLSESWVSHEFRTTVVKGIHTKESLLAAARLLPRDACYFLQGFVDSGRLIRPEGLSAFSAEEMAAFCDAVRPLVPSVSLRGI